MQQLLGDKLGASTDTNSFLRELFLQRLPPNVRMVLTSANPATTLKNLADMADKIMEVSAPIVAALSTPRIDDYEVKQLRKQVSRLADLVASLPRATAAPPGTALLPTCHPRLNPLPRTPSAGIMPSSVMTPGSLGIPAAGDRKTPRLDTRGDRHFRPSLKSPFLHK